MAHNIGQMFYFGERPWHRLGEELKAPATLEQALAAGGLDWEVTLQPIVPAGEPESRIGHRVAVVRTDKKPGETGRVVGVVHPGFEPLQNRQGAHMFDTLMGKGVPFLEQRDKNHFIRVDPPEWQLALDALDASRPRTAE